ncbi:nucleoside-diphosphate kinase [Patescibacteria group bacterium]|nr:nucleoside-diphosphate kinase [Patescibacteria group bacterium]MBU4477011.1 nucleoside-diphosphate kinase [Patescibacteria group bacterium]MCG2699338.1 nucleoside-diphosphate kinase [Candidatus Parcubacteria bacterium]
MKHEKTLIIIKPDAMQRNLLGGIISRFERKGLRITGLKMMAIDDLKISEHYEHHKDKPFFDGLKKYMQSAPVAVMVLSGLNAVAATRLIVGPTKGYEADAGSIRGDFSMSGQCNIVHASDSAENAEKEIYRFFNEDELFEYKKIDFEFIYGEDEREG